MTAPRTTSWNNLRLEARKTTEWLETLLNYHWLFLLSTSLIIELYAYVSREKLNWKAHIATPAHYESEKQHLSACQ